MPDCPYYPSPGSRVRQPCSPPGRWASLARSRTRSLRTRLPRRGSLRASLSTRCRNRQRSSRPHTLAGTGWSWGVEDAPRDRATRGCGIAVVLVGEDGVHVRRIVRHPLVDGPAEVGSLLKLVDLLPSVLPHVVYENGALAGLDGELEGVAQSQSPDRPVVARSRRVRVEGVVGGDGAVLVYAQHLAKEVGELLCDSPPSVVTGGDVKLAVLAEV